eukprot:PhF_6_TR37833/c0_g1_i1/m.56316
MYNPYCETKFFGVHLRQGYITKIEFESSTFTVSTACCSIANQGDVISIHTRVYPSQEWQCSTLLTDSNNHTSKLYIHRPTFPVSNAVVEMLCEGSCCVSVTGHTPRGFTISTIRIHPQTPATHSLSATTSMTPMTTSATAPDTPTLMAALPSVPLTPHHQPVSSLVWYTPSRAGKTVRVRSAPTLHNSVIMGFLEPNEVRAAVRVVVSEDGGE